MIFAWGTSLFTCVGRFYFHLIKFFLLPIPTLTSSALTSIGVEEIAHLDVPVDDPVLVQVRHAPQQLQHQVLDFRGGKARVHVVDEVGHVVL